MNKIGVIMSMGEHYLGQSETLLREQYANLKGQIPLMYLLMFISVLFLAIANWGASPAFLNIGMPAILGFALVSRAAEWTFNRHRKLSIADVKRDIRRTVVMVAAISLLFGGWGLMLFHHAQPAQSHVVALYVFVGAIGCCYCLQALPIAGRYILLFGALPVTLHLLASGDHYLMGIGGTFVVVGLVILRTLATNQSGVSRILRSRAGMSALVKALRQSEENHRYSVDLNPQIPWISDASGAIIEFGARWEAVTGMPIGRALGNGWMAALHPDDLSTVVKAWTNSTQSSGSVLPDIRYRLRQADGAYRWIRARAYPRRDAEGQVICWYGNLEDIHEQVSAERALMESEERYRLASRVTSDIIWDWKHAQDRIEWAQRVNDMFGYPDIAGGTTIDWWLERIHPDDRQRVAQMLDTVRNGEKDSWSHEYRFRAASGSYLHLISRAYVVRDDQGRAFRSIGAILDITQAKSVEHGLRLAAYHDSLTGLPNRKLFAERLQSALTRAKETQTAVGVIVFDVDGFKLINDSFGHAAGDLVLQAVGDRVQANLSTDATAARLGGDEFAVILPDLPQGADHIDVMEQVLDGVEQDLTFDEGVIGIRLSAGAAMWPRDGEAAEDVLKSADLALYAVKADGTGGLREFEPSMRVAVETRQIMLRDARQALRDDRVIPFYQPKIMLASGRLAGFEALLRWHHHSRGLQPPGSIRGAFEDNAVSVQLTDRMIDRVLADMTEWLDRGFEFGRIAINGSPADFQRDDFAERILSRVARAGVPASLLELEVTETVFLGRGTDHVGRALATLRTAGVKIALDDFGTGYASLTHLQEFPVDILKIDRSFISRLDGSMGTEMAIVHGLVEIARRMNITTVAEGVETQFQRDQLRALGCDIGQGFLFSRPISAVRVPALLTTFAEGNAAAIPATRTMRPRDASGTEPAGTIAQNLG